MNTAERPVSPYGVPFTIEGRSFVRYLVVPKAARAHAGYRSAARAAAYSNGYRPVDVVSSVTQPDGSEIVELQIDTPTPVKGKR